MQFINHFIKADANAMPKRTETLGPIRILELLMGYVLVVCLFVLRLNVPHRSTIFQ